MTDSSTGAAARSALRTEALEQLLVEQGSGRPRRDGQVHQHLRDGRRSAQRCQGRRQGMDRSRVPQAAARRRHRRHRRTRLQGSAGRAHRRRARTRPGAQRRGLHAVLVLPVAGARAAADLVQGPGLPRRAWCASRVRCCAEMGLDLADDVEIRVWDSSSEVRCLVLPRAAGRHRGRCPRRSWPSWSPATRWSAWRRWRRHDASRSTLDWTARPRRRAATASWSSPNRGRAARSAWRWRSPRPGAFDWDDFRDALIARISSGRPTPPEGECWSYYRCWLLALEDVTGRPRCRHRDAGCASAVPNSPPGPPATTTITRR